MNKFVSNKSLKTDVGVYVKSAEEDAWHLLDTESIFIQADLYVMQSLYNEIIPVKCHIMEISCVD